MNFIGRIIESDRIVFCYVHFAKQSIIPDGIKNNYPFVINFDELPGRIGKFKDDLVKIINGTTSSYYLDLAKQLYHNIGQNLIRKFTALLNHNMIFSN